MKISKTKNLYNNQMIIKNKKYLMINIKKNKQKINKSEKGI